MLTTSYEAFLGMDCLRHSANISKEEMAAIMGISGHYYRRVLSNVKRADGGTLNTKMDLKVRKHISYLIYGLLNSEYLPIMSNHPQRRDLLNQWLSEAQENCMMTDWTPLGIHALYSHTSLDDMIKIAKRFAG